VWYPSLLNSSSSRAFVLEKSSAFSSCHAHGHASRARRGSNTFRSASGSRSLPLMYFFIALYTRWDGALYNFVRGPVKIWQKCLFALNSKPVYSTHEITRDTCTSHIAHHMSTTCVHAHAHAHAHVHVCMRMLTCACTCTCTCYNILAHTLGAKTATPSQLCVSLLAEGTEQAE
jgi:hypothetical protein